MLDAAKEDFRQIKVPPEVRESLTSQFVDLLESSESYA